MATTKFQLGRLVATPGALEAVPLHDIKAALARHHSGDWGEVCESDGALNDEAITDGSRILSAYVSSNDTKFWIITEADRSCTTVLLPSEY
jgi:hypothetical protein